MVYAKVQLFEKGLQENADLFKALAHPARLAILKYLSEQQVCITGDITEELPLSRTTVNQHLAELKRVGLILGTIEGTRTNYCIDPSRLKELHCGVDSFFNSITSAGKKPCG